ncbi:hypothetical protein H257_02892 [Aphanomyces astaci]|uniref:Uncharacterized protein n=1 Tax=Aphanomyces astaci TaxID=112090 RepID=W4H162_APHAT|nr:hypothetical protein H257_02892 [Aphanomyces astaci]ETV84999.1 hypothetical protein H257_02892 [Aphanomyces astaci]|eukprot:XP_009825017.1 hypothetical protein H257_02892 [Aphanomyces astaci]
MGKSEFRRTGDARKAEYFAQPPRYFTVLRSALLPHLPQPKACDFAICGPLVPLSTVLEGATAGRCLLDEAVAEDEQGDGVEPTVQPPRYFTVLRSALLPHLPQPKACDFAICGPLVPLSTVLEGATAGRCLLDEAVAEDEQGDGVEPTVVRGKPSASPPGIHAYVNRVLGRILPGANVITNVTSHSFRRGGAHGSRELEHVRYEQVVHIEFFKAHLFSGCTGLSNTVLNVSPQVVDVLCAYLIKALPPFQSMKPDSPLVKRVDQAISASGVDLAEMASWSIHLAQVQTTNTSEQDVPSSKYLRMIEHQAAVIDQLIDHTKTMSKRIRDVEHQVGLKTSPTSLHLPSHCCRESDEEKPGERRKRKNTCLWECWYDWFVNHAHSTELDKQWKSTMRRCVAYMHLFADNLDVDESAATYRDTVLADGHILAAKVLAFLVERGVSASSTGSVERKLRAIHKKGELGVLILQSMARPPRRQPHVALPWAQLFTVAQGWTRQSYDNKSHKQGERGTWFAA